MADFLSWLGGRLGWREVWPWLHHFSGDLEPDPRNFRVSPALFLQNGTQSPRSFPSTKEGELMPDIIRPLDMMSTMLSVSR